MLVAGLGLLFLVAMLMGTLVAGVTLGTEGDDHGTPTMIAAEDIVPALFGLVVTVAAISVKRWWPWVLRDSVPTRPWVWVVPVIVAAGALVATDWARLGGAGAVLVLWLAFGVLTIAVTEELFFRGLVLTALRGSFSEPFAAGWTVVIFALAHSLGSLAFSPAQLVATASGGVVYYLTKRVSASIWPAALVHALVDFSLFSITLGLGETEANRAPFVLLALVLAPLVALAGVKRIAPRASANSG